MIILAVARAYLRKAENACGMDKREDFLVNLLQFEHRPSSKRLQIYSSWSVKFPKEFKKDIACG